MINIWRLPFVHTHLRGDDDVGQSDNNMKSIANSIVFAYIFCAMCFTSAAAGYGKKRAMKRRVTSSDIINRTID